MRIVDLPSSSPLYGREGLVVKIDPAYYRPSEVKNLLGDPSKAKEKLGWEAKCSLEELVSEMIEMDKKIARKDLLIKNKGL